MQLEKNEQGFFLMIEGGHIDRAGHARDEVANVIETIEFA
ncbi:MAG: alkaline phosphatase [Candidatus Heimdallarchaeota archaeon]|nr:alkaline phosphatase [Candidatus Heimdallarchaeota archaeon]